MVFLNFVKIGHIYVEESVFCIFFMPSQCYSILTFVFILFLGVIIFYELWIRGTLKPDLTRDPPEKRIFHPSGQFNPRPTLKPQENALEPPATSYVASGLNAFTFYEFQVFFTLLVPKTYQ